MYNDVGILWARYDVILLYPRMNEKNKWTSVPRRERGTFFNLEIYVVFHFFFSLFIPLLRYYVISCMFCLFFFSSPINTTCRVLPSSLSVVLLLTRISCFLYGGTQLHSRDQAYRNETRERARKAFFSLSAASCPLPFLLPPLPPPPPPRQA